MFNLKVKLGFFSVLHWIDKNWRGNYQQKFQITNDHVVVIRFLVFTNTSSNVLKNRLKTNARSSK